MLFAKLLIGGGVLLVVAVLLPCSDAIRCKQGTVGGEGGLTEKDCSEFHEDISMCEIYFENTLMRTMKTEYRCALPSQKEVRCEKPQQKPAPEEGVEVQYHSCFCNTDLCDADPAKAPKPVQTTTPKTKTGTAQSKITKKTTKKHKPHFRAVTDKSSGVSLSVIGTWTWAALLSFDATASSA